VCSPTVMQICKTYIQALAMLDAPVAQQKVLCRPGFAASRVRLGPDTKTQVLIADLPDGKLLI